VHGLDVLGAKENSRNLRYGSFVFSCQRKAPTKGRSEQTFALCFLACQLALAADRFSFLACFFLGRFLEMLPKLHFAKNTLTLELFLQGAERLIDVVVANTNLHVVFTTFLS